MGASDGHGHDAADRGDEEADRADRGLPGLDAAVLLGGEAHRDATGRSRARPSSRRRGDDEATVSSRAPRLASSAATSIRTARRAGPDGGADGHDQARAARRPPPLTAGTWISSGMPAISRGDRRRGRRDTGPARPMPAATPEEAADRAEHRDLEDRPADEQPREPPSAPTMAVCRRRSSRDRVIELRTSTAADAEGEQGDDREQREEGGEHHPDDGRRIQCSSTAWSSGQRCGHGGLHGPRRRCRPSGGRRRCRPDPSG